jgi:hypothetical protein
MSIALDIAIIGGGPAGLFAALRLAEAGRAVTLFDAKPSVGRKFLMAGKGGLNLTNSEDFDLFVARYGEAAEWMAPYLKVFTPSDLRAFAESLNVSTFVGTSGHVFPEGMKATPLLRAWLKKLAALGVIFKTRRRWTGWREDGALLFEGPEGDEVYRAKAALLALGGASWKHLGSDGGWAEVFAREGIPLAPFRPANCGFICDWTEHFRNRFAGAVLMPIVLRFGDKTLQGEAVITEKGIEGGAVYALSALLRDAIEAQGEVVLHLDLRPSFSEEELVAHLRKPRGSQSLSNFLRKAAGLSPVAIGLMREAMVREKVNPETPEALADLIKNLPLRLSATTGIERAISVAGGVKREALDEYLMLRRKRGIFCAGEMVDWEAPTGGYMLQGCFSTGAAAARGILDWVARA